MAGFVMVVVLLLSAGLSHCVAGDDELFTVTSGDGDMVTLPPNITCQEGPEAGSLPPANQTCDCGSRGYFYGNYCGGVDLEAADDINTSKRVMEIRWNANPNFPRAYAFLYQEESAREEPPRTQPLILEKAPGEPGEPGYHYAWLTYLTSGDIRYTVCILQEKAAQVIRDAGDEDAWGQRINDANQDCVSITTEASVTQEATIAAIVVGVAIGVTLIVVFTANLCVNIKGGRAGEQPEGGAPNHPQAGSQHGRWGPNHRTQVYRVGSQYGALGS